MEEGKQAVTGIVHLGELKDGTKVKIYKDKTHYRAFNAAGVQVGEPFISLEVLMERIAATMIGAENDSPEECPPAEVKKNDGTDEESGD